MPAGPVGACWESGSWEDTAWEEDSWGDGEVSVLPAADYDSTWVAVASPTDWLASGGPMNWTIE
jgi:hypothetical protein